MNIYYINTVNSKINATRQLKAPIAPTATTLKKVNIHYFISSKYLNKGNSYKVYIKYSENVFRSKNLNEIANVCQGLKL